MAEEIECPCCHGEGSMQCRDGCHDSPCDVCGETGYVDPEIAKRRMRPENG